MKERFRLTINEDGSSNTERNIETIAEMLYLIEVLSFHLGEAIDGVLDAASLIVTNMEDPVEGFSSASIEAMKVLVASFLENNLPVKNDLEFDDFADGTMVSMFIDAMQEELRTVFDDEDEELAAELAAEGLFNHLN